MRNRSRTYILIFLAVFVFCGIDGFCFAAATSNLQEVAFAKHNQSQDESFRPMIIWWGRIVDDYETMETALSSGIFSHVMIVNSYKNSQRDILNKGKVDKILRLCKKTNVIPVWTRWLYPGGQLNGFTLKDAFNTTYYINQINNIKSEANALGIGLTALDTEPYANKPLAGISKRKLSTVEFNNLNKAVKEAVRIAGQVDFVLPEGGENERYFYNCICNIGKLKISEYTYYDIPSNYSEKAFQSRPFDIAGVFVGITKKNINNPQLLLFTPREILERQELWSKRKGLFIYTGNRQEAALVAREFAKINNIFPAIDENAVRIEVNECH